MAFYVAQHEDGDRIVKMGYAEEGRVEERMREHETSAGPIRLVFVVSGQDRKFEDSILKRFAKFRRSRRRTKARPFELFRPAPELMRFFSSRTARELGFTKVGSWVRATEYAREWLARGAEYNSEEAAFALSEEMRLRKHTPKSARGGWDLWELIAGTISRQLCIDFPGIESHGVSFGKLNGWPLHIITYQGIEYRFPVFAEACERMGMKPLPGSIRLGIRPRNVKTPSGRKGVPIKKKPPPQTGRPSNPNQAEMFSIHNQKRRAS